MKPLANAPRPRYCVIGAGAAGLAAMRALIEKGHDFDCFETTDRVGGHWHTDYDNLHLITPRDGSGFRGDPMPDRWADFPRRAQMVEYLEGHADRFDLRRVQEPR
jgi:cation diffusion facilitator CzcD-associated flavoprotein CzcO